MSKSRTPPKSAVAEAIELAIEAIGTSCCDVDICDRSNPLLADTHGCATNGGYCIRMRALDALTGLYPSTPQFCEFSKGNRECTGEAVAVIEMPPTAPKRERYACEVHTKAFEGCKIPPPVRRFSSVAAPNRPTPEEET